MDELSTFCGFRENSSNLTVAVVHNSDENQNTSDIFRKKLTEEVIFFKLAIILVEVKCFN